MLSRTKINEQLDDADARQLALAVANYSAKLGVGGSVRVRASFDSRGCDLESWRMPSVEYERAA